MNEIIPINLAVEDALSEAVIRKIFDESRREYSVGFCLPKRGFGYLKNRINGLNSAAKGTPYFVLTDLDNDECPPQKIASWLGHGRNNNLIFRIAVRSVESWVIADRKSFSQFIGIPIKLIPETPDLCGDPKRELLSLVSKSRKKEVKEAILPKKGSTARVGPDYNGMLTYYVNNYWQINEAKDYSPSLKSTILAIENFRPVY